MEVPSHVLGLHEKPFHPELLQAVFCHLTKAMAFRILSFEKFSAYIIINPLLQIPGFLNGTYNVGDKSLAPCDLLNEKKIAKDWLLSGLLNRASLLCLQWSMKHHEMSVLVIHCTMTKQITKCNQLQRQKHTHIYKTTFPLILWNKEPPANYIILCFEPVIQYRQPCLRNLSLCFIKPPILLTGFLLSSKDQVPLRNWPRRNLT